MIQTVSIVVLVVATLVLAIVVSNVVSSRNAERRANDRQTVARCFSSAATAPALARVLSELAEHVPGAAFDITNFRRVSLENAPTIRECRRLADTLHIPRPKGAQ